MVEELKLKKICTLSKEGTVVEGLKLKKKSVHLEKNVQWSEGCNLKKNPIKIGKNSTEFI